MTAGTAAAEAVGTAVVSCRDVVVEFGAARVLHGVSAEVRQGRVVGLVGESGSGKSTLAKAIVGMNRIASGELWIDGEEVSRASRSQRHRLYRKVQYVPQDPYSSLNPRRTIGQTLAEAIDPVGGTPRRHTERIAEALEAMWLDPSDARKYPHEFSGGQRQRIAIARALLVDPSLIVADEITSALDVSVQAEVIRVLQELKQDGERSMLFITHNLAVAQEVCDDVVVMLHGEIVENGPTERVFRSPESEYTQKLLDSVPGGPGFSL
ncbi:ABC transporter ATP-binding protein [Brevibacterium album]|uniref:ABC transporter ATP-binding protein n=1 Tax=Brevibacterium album TaxID=417948 RepID=UPI00041548DD|nr:ABC transporter ATP-binding protein [Brevibacterium album]